MFSVAQQSHIFNFSKVLIYSPFTCNIETQHALQEIQKEIPKTLLWM